MQRLPNSQVRFQFGARGWAAIALGLAMLAALSLLAIGFFFLILPVVLLAPILFWFLPKPKIHKVGARSGEPPTKATSVIEGDFKVISSAQNRNSDPEGT
jgi:hypothetical protein